ncbi:MAG TPA: SRPBCC family protein [Gammaproteobacteria bacterium]|nr:SRPBCC family protein [Gammaproteobacteria bacterium]
MTLIKHEGIAACPPQKLFGLINLVEQYPKFLSWCKSVTIDNRTPKAIQATVFIQKYGISFHCPFTYTLRSKNEILVSLPSGGPFYTISGTWRFQAYDNKTKFSFELQLEHKNTWWINFFLLPILKSEIKNVIKAFEQRAL